MKSAPFRLARTITPIDRAVRFLSETIWQVDPRTLDRRRRVGVMALRIVYLVGRAFASNRVQTQASSLTYMTMLGLVPAFAVVFSFLQSFGGLQGTQDRVRDFLLGQIAATPDVQQMIQDRLPELVSRAREHVSAGSGIAGAAGIFLALTVISLLGSVEKTLNDIWGVTRARSFVQKFVVYWAVATLGPVLLGIALVTGSSLLAKASSELAPGRLWSRVTGSRLDKPAPAWRGPAGAITAEVERARNDFANDGQALDWVLTGERPGEKGGSQTIGLLLTAVAFSLLYAFMPNTKVRLGPAFVGGFVAAGLWAATRWALASSSSALVQYNTIYGSLATVPILMVWFYISWIVVILGAELTFAIQNMRAQGREELALEASEKTREVVALRLVAAISEAFVAGDRPPSLSELAEKIGAPLVLCADILHHLCEEGTLRELDLEKDERGYLPARPVERITFGEVIRALRDKRGTSFALEPGADAVLVERELRRARAAEDAVSGAVGFDRLVAELRAARAAAPPAAGPADPGPAGSNA